jgi:MFS family permease
VLSCALTVPLNALFGRRGTVLAASIISVVTMGGQAFTNTWWQLFIARLTLGLAIGPKSATTPIWAAECAPPAIRGALVMQWQLWTAFGNMLGYAADLAFFHVRDTPSGGTKGLNWRLMLASATLPALIVCMLVCACPESPRWYMSRGRHEDAYRAMVRLRHCRVQAARDVFYMYTLLEAEADMMHMGRNKLLDLVTVPRNRRALVASAIVMFMQQVGFNTSLHLAKHCQTGPLLIIPQSIPPRSLAALPSNQSYRLSAYKRCTLTAFGASGEAFFTRPGITK